MALATRRNPPARSFKAGKGVLLTDETRKILGVEVADVTEQKLPAEIRFNVQVFGENISHAIRENPYWLRRSRLQASCRWTKPPPADSGASCVAQQ